MINQDWEKLDKSQWDSLFALNALTDCKIDNALVSRINERDDRLEVVRPLFSDQFALVLDLANSQLLDILVRDRQGISQELARTINDFCGDQKFTTTRFFAFLVKDQQDLLYPLHRLCSGQHIIKDLHFRNYHELDGIPDDLTITGNVLFSGSPYRSRPFPMPRNLTVIGDLSLIDSGWTELTESLTVSGELIIESNVVNKPVSCKSLFCSRDSPSDFSPFTIEESVIISQSKATRLSNIRARSVSIYECEAKTMANIFAENDLEILRCSKLTNIGLIHARTLKIKAAQMLTGLYNKSKIYDLTVDFCYKLDLSGLVLTRLNCEGRVSSLKNMVVMEDAVISIDQTIPESFCCLGQLNRT